MVMPIFDLSFIVFLATIATTFLVAWMGRLHSHRVEAGPLANQKLNRWLIGLSAGATANSGFVVTGAVGLGFSYGAQWLMLPIAWLLGDIVFWTLFPHRINRAGALVRATTLTDVLVSELEPAQRTLPKRLIGLAMLVCVGGYIAAQWLAGQKFIHGAFEIEGRLALAIFAAMIVAYTAIGGFRGSIYADSFQAVLRVVGTTVALVAVIWVAQRTPAFTQNWQAAGLSFTDPFPQTTSWAAIGFILGYAAASLGFGLGQPQIFTRYLAGASPSETRSAWWIYMAFVQFTWIAMTAFGMVLRGIMPGLQDPEAGLSVFFRADMGPLLTGLITADVFATIAATSNSLLVAMAQTARFDLLATSRSTRGEGGLWVLTAFLGALTMAASLVLQSSVFGLAIASVSLLGAGLAPVMAARLFGWRPSRPALLISVTTGLAVAATWLVLGYSSIINEAAPGMLAGAVAVLVSSLFFPARSPAIREAGNG